MKINQIHYRNRRAVQLENETVRVIILEEGGHIAAIEEKQTGINPLWTPPWESIEPSTYQFGVHPQYGENSEGKLLAGIMGHNLALDIFGPPSKEEFAAGLTVHGEASVLPYEFDGDREQVIARVHLPLAQLSLERRIALRGSQVLFEETVKNLTASDRPIAWTQHVTLGPPFLEPGVTQLKMPVRQSAVYPYDLGPGALYEPGVFFDWPHVPHKDGTFSDLSVYPDHAPSTAITGHLVETGVQPAFFMTWQPREQVLFGYVWERSDFPWVSLWEENHARSSPPWNGKTAAWGIEFGVSPYAEPRRALVERVLFPGERSYRWLPAQSQITVKYSAFIRTSSGMPETLPSDLL